MKIFDKRAANTIPYPAKEVEKNIGERYTNPAVQTCPSPRHAGNKL